MDTFVLKKISCKNIYFRKKTASGYPHFRDWAPLALYVGAYRVPRENDNKKCQAVFRTFVEPRDAPSQFSLKLHTYTFPVKKPQVNRMSEKKA